MGYTHYYKQRSSVLSTKWASFKTKLSPAFDHLPEYSSSAGRVGGPSGPRLVIADGMGENVLSSANMLFTPNQFFSEDGTKLRGESVWFNGLESKEGDWSHETFWLTRLTQGDDAGSWFTKTARKPYDWLVCAALILINHESPGSFDISSDGDVDDWEPVIKWLTEVLAEPLRLPKDIDPSQRIYAPTGMMNVAAVPLEQSWEASTSGEQSFYF